MASSVKPVMVHAKQRKSARDRCHELLYRRKCTRPIQLRGAHRTWLLEHVIKQRWQCRRQSIRIQRKLLRQRTKTNACRQCATSGDIHSPSYRRPETALTLNVLLFSGGTSRHTMHMGSCGHGAK